MTASLIPLPSWRELYPAGPPDVRLDTVGPWCPLDDSRLDIESIGWCCGQCGAGWTFHGRCGQWLGVGTELAVPLVEDSTQDAALMLAERRTSPAYPDGGGRQAAVAAAVASARLRRVDRVAAASIAVGAVSVAGYVAGQATGDWPALPDVWLRAIAAAIGGAALLLLAVAALAGWYERRRFAGNELLDTGVSDGPR